VVSTLTEKIVFLNVEKFIEQNLNSIKNLLLRYGVEKAYLFGSVVRDQMKSSSDVDFIIKFPDDMHYETYANNYFALATELENLLHRNVDLVTEKTLKNPYLLQTINKDKYRLI
jgi:predicted nucleotidyltransferase